MSHCHRNDRRIWANPHGGSLGPDLQDQEQRRSVLGTTGCPDLINHPVKTDDLLTTNHDATAGAGKQLNQVRVVDSDLETEDVRDGDLHSREWRGRQSKDERTHFVPSINPRTDRLGFGLSVESTCCEAHRQSSRRSGTTE